MIDKIKAARRSGRVQRFHCYDMIRRENVAEHTYNMMNILMVLSGGAVSQNLLVAAFLHDQGEYVTGDIPSPVKRVLTEEDLGIITSMEANAVNFIHYKGAPELTDWEHKMLKLADNLDGWLKSCEEIRMGNDEMRDVRATYARYIADLVCEIKGNIAHDVDMIMEHYHD